MKGVLVTGANGFVGSNLCRFFERNNISYQRAVRSSGSASEDYNTIITGDLSHNTDLSKALIDIDAVVHLAARVHVMQDSVEDPLVKYRSVNVDGTLNLARQAAKYGVRRFIFISTIKVNGEETFDKPFSVDDKPSPVDPYSLSKYEAEEALKKVASETGMELVIIRPPMIYGKGVGGNYTRLVKLVRKGWCLPLGMIRNKRSLVGIENLCSLISRCLEAPEAAGRTFLVSDGKDVSTPDLVRLIGSCCNRRIWLIPIPVWLLRIAGALVGRRHEVERLVGNLQIDSSKTCQLLGWQPPLTLGEGIKQSII